MDRYPTPVVMLACFCTVVSMAAGGQILDFAATTVEKMVPLFTVATDAVWYALTAAPATIVYVVAALLSAAYALPAIIASLPGGFVAFVESPLEESSGAFDRFFIWFMLCLWTLLISVLAASHVAPFIPPLLESLPDEALVSQALGLGPAGLQVVVDQANDLAESVLETFKRLFDEYTGIREKCQAAKDEYSRINDQSWKELDQLYRLDRTRAAKFTSHKPTWVLGDRRMRFVDIEKYTFLRDTTAQGLEDVIVKLGTVTGKNKLALDLLNADVERATKHFEEIQKARMAAVADRFEAECATGEWKRDLAEKEEAAQRYRLLYGPGGPYYYLSSMFAPRYRLVPPPVVDHANRSASEAAPTTTNPPLVQVVAVVDEPVAAGPVAVESPVEGLGHLSLAEEAPVSYLVEASEEQEQAQTQQGSQVQWGYVAGIRTRFEETCHRLQALSVEAQLERQRLHDLELAWLAQQREAEESERNRLFLLEQARQAHLLEAAENRRQLDLFRQEETRARRAEFKQREAEAQARREADAQASRDRLAQAEAERIAVEATRVAEAERAAEALCVADAARREEAARNVEEAARAQAAFSAALAEQGEVDKAYAELLASYPAKQKAREAAKLQAEEEAAQLLLGFAGHAEAIETDQEAEQEAPATFEVQAEAQCFEARPSRTQRSRFRQTEEELQRVDSYLSSVWGRYGPESSEGPVVNASIVDGEQDMPTGRVDELQLLLAAANVYQQGHEPVSNGSMDHTAVPHLPDTTIPDAFDVGVVDADDVEEAHWEPLAAYAQEMEDEWFNELSADGINNGSSDAEMDSSDSEEDSDADMESQEGVEWEDVVHSATTTTRRGPSPPPSGRRILPARAVNTRRDEAQAQLDEALVHNASLLGSLQQNQGESSQSPAQATGGITQSPRLSDADALRLTETHMSISSSPVSGQTPEQKREAERLANVQRLAESNARAQEQARLRRIQVKKARRHRAV